MTRREKEIALAKALGWTRWTGSSDPKEWEYQRLNPHEYAVRHCWVLNLLKELATRKQSVLLGYAQSASTDKHGWFCEVGLLGDDDIMSSSYCLTPEEAVFEAAYEALVKHDKT